MTSFVRNGVPKDEHGRLDLKPKKHHGWTGFIMFLGFLLPPLAVAARFGIGTDFFINVILTICGYFPGHGHNFFIQNIRNNDNKKRTPRWASKLGLVDDSEIKRIQRNRQWAGRYNERSANRVFYDDQGNAFTEQDPRAARPKRQRPGAERYLGNPDDDLPGGSGGRSRKKSGKGGANGSSSSISRISSRSSVTNNSIPLDPRDPYAAERKAAERGDSRSRSNGKARESSRSRPAAGARLGDEFLNPTDPDDDLTNGALDPRDPYAAERQAYGGGSSRSRNGRGNDFLNDDTSDHYGAPSGRDPYAAEREGFGEAPKKKSWFKKDRKQADAQSDFINPPGSRY
ncbi:hypothetical protein OC846_002094 [Tilletia horrida]|uniref:Uncharacterized protein n=1 Tax=Tilletia horrida TaxID=155126 RepID=A0AAN6GSJ3_9BASI|nr:hypothetical protein OC846_002094 [Tilletia horrida]